MFAFVQTHKLAGLGTIVWQIRELESGPQRKNSAGGLWWPCAKCSKAGHGCGRGAAQMDEIQIVMPPLCLNRIMFTYVNSVKQSKLLIVWASHIARAPKGAF